MTIPYRAELGRDYYDAIRAKNQGGFSTEEEGFLSKALGSDSNGTGGEFIPEGFSAEVIMQIYEDNWARQLFGTYLVTTGLKDNIPKFSSKLTEESANISSPIDALPTELTSTTSIESSDMTTTEVEIELKTFALHLPVTNKFFAYNVNRQILTILKDEMANAMVEGEEDILVNGDTETSSASNINYTYNASTNVHGVNTATGDNEHLLLFDGLRKSAGGTAVTNGGAAWDESDFRELLKNLGVFARKGRENLAYLVSPEIYLAMLGFEETQTINKYGKNATIVVGELAKIYNIRVIVTDKMPCSERSTLTAASGLREASANSYTEMAVVWIKTVILGVPNKPERTFNVIKDLSEMKYDRTPLIAIEDFGVAFRYTTAIVRGYYGTA